MDDSRPLNYTHEYQVVFIEPSDGSHVFGVQLGTFAEWWTLFVRNADSCPGSPFTNPTGELPAPGAQNFKILDHGLNVLFSTPFTCGTWHNFAIVVDWDNLTLAVYYSAGSQPLKLVSPPKSNQGVKAGPDGKGEFHFGVLKVCYHHFDETSLSDGTLEIVALG